MAAKKKIKAQDKKNKKSTKEIKEVVKKNVKHKVIRKKVEPEKRKQKVKRRLYSTLEMEKAINAVNARGMSIRKVAAKFNVPATSLHRAAKNPQQSPSRPGPS